MVLQFHSHHKDKGLVISGSKAIYGYFVWAGL